MLLPTVAEHAHMMIVARSAYIYAYIYINLQNGHLQMEGPPNKGHIPFILRKLAVKRDDNISKRSSVFLPSRIQQTCNRG